MKSAEIAVRTGRRPGLFDLTDQCARFVAGEGGRLALGTWQSIALLDTNVDNDARTVRLSFVRG